VQSSHRGRAATSFYISGRTIDHLHHIISKDGDDKEAFTLRAVLHSST